MKNKQAFREGRIQKYPADNALSIKEAGGAVTKVTARLEPECFALAQCQKRNIVLTAKVTKCAKKFTHRIRNSRAFELGFIACFLGRAA